MMGERDNSWAVKFPFCCRCCSLCWNLECEWLNALVNAQLPNWAVIHSSNSIQSVTFKYAHSLSYLYVCVYRQAHGYKQQLEEGGGETVIWN